MIYKFKSPATSNVIMLGPQGDQLLQLLGHAPGAQGIIEPAAMPAAIAALEAAIAEHTAQAAPEAEDGDDDHKQPAPTVGLHARLWPMLDMLRRAQAAGKPVVWGV